MRLMSGHYYLGIDAGGTKTAFTLADEKGNTVRTAVLGPGNPNDIGMERAFELLSQGVEEVCRGISLSDVTAFAGISGGISGNNRERLGEFFSGLGFAEFDNGSDIENLVGLSGADRCILVIMGTGFAVYAVNGEERRRISGWGQFFDAGGCGYTLGRDAVAAALSHGDGSGEPTLITSLLEEKLGELPSAHLSEFYRRGKAYIASFGETVFEAAEKGDWVAQTILENNMAFAAEKINAGLAWLAPGEDGQIPVLFSGGVSAKSDVIFPIIEKHLVCLSHRLGRLSGEPVDGAVNVARGLKKKRKEI